MKRLALLAAGSLLAAVPAVIGLTGNPALSHEVPVRIPSGAHPVKPADTQPEPSQTRAGGGDDRSAASPAPGASRHAEPGDDHGGRIPGASPSDDRSGSGGSGSSGSSGSGGSGRSGGGDDPAGHN